MDGSSCLYKEGKKNEQEYRAYLKRTKRGKWIKQRKWENVQNKSMGKKCDVGGCTLVHCTEHRNEQPN